MRAWSSSFVSPVDGVSSVGADSEGVDVAAGGEGACIATALVSALASAPITLLRRVCPCVHGINNDRLEQA